VPGPLQKVKAWQRQKRGVNEAPWESAPLTGAVEWRARRFNDMSLTDLAAAVVGTHRRAALGAPVIGAAAAHRAIPAPGVSTPLFQEHAAYRQIPVKTAAYNVETPAHQ
jgi:hypothetical protein